ncbi:MAG: MMPL family transporter [bacterium]|nr:MMPL family transporter [bacterium]
MKVPRKSTTLWSALGAWIVRHRALVVACWLACIGLAGLGANRVTEVLTGGSGSVPDSPSRQVERILRNEFSNPYAHLVAVVVSSHAPRPDLSMLHETAQDLVNALRSRKEVSRVIGPGDPSPIPLTSEAGHRIILLVGLDAADATEALNMMPTLRDLTRSVTERHRERVAGLEIAVTGMPAVTYDINRHSSDDTSRAEGRLLPVTVLVLLFAFGGLVAAGLPLLVGFGATGITLGIAFVLARWLELSIYVQNVASMIGLAVGIDYSLLMVHRFRQAWQQHGDTERAIAETLETAGVAITFSGLTVAIGLGAMAFTPLLDSRSVGLGGLLVVVVSVLMALTLLPALLSWLGPRIDAPRRLSTWILRQADRSRWEPWIRGILDRPLRAALLSLGLLLGLAAPLAKVELGYPDTALFPPYMDSVKGIEALDAMGLSGTLIPLHVLVRDPDGPVLRTKHLRALMDLSAELRGHPLISSVASPVDLGKSVGPLQLMLLYRDPERAMQRFPLIRELFVSRDRHTVLFQVIPQRSADLPALRRLADDLARREMPGGLELRVGGTPTFYNDHERAVLGTFPFVAGFILLSTLVLMGLAFRSILVPIKAVLLNLLSVGAGCGAVVAVYQFGWGRALFGMGHVHDAMPIPAILLLMLFCIVFGLSMDYEVFLMSAIKERFDAHGDNTRAVLEGTCGSARLITSAAGIMVAVFGAFAWADFVIVKMLGLGLATAVLVDATLIRLVLLPATMKLAGRANWYPGDRPVRADVTPGEGPRPQGSV